MILIDAHVHIYDCYDLNEFLDAACANFTTGAARLGHHGVFAAVLLLAETSSENWFERLTEAACRKHTFAQKPRENWTLHRTKESTSLSARRADFHRLFIIAGRQIVTAEYLEVLALAIDNKFEEGTPLEKLLAAVKQTGAVPTIPWGPGKWLGKRGDELRRLLDGSQSSGIFLGDNGNRPVFWPRPFHFTLAEKKGLKVLPGSDPLPFASEATRPGSFGCSIDGSISSDYPARDLQCILRDPETVLRAYGTLERPWRFFRNQLEMQIIKRLRNRKSVKL
jgi:hypothetical protein